MNDDWAWLSALSSLPSNPGSSLTVEIAIAVSMACQPLLSNVTPGSQKTSCGPYALTHSSPSWSSSTVYSVPHPAQVVSSPTSALVTIPHSRHAGGRESPLVGSQYGRMNPSPHATAYP